VVVFEINEQIDPPRPFIDALEKIKGRDPIRPSFSDC